jgi:purine catabolism regulator
MGLTLGQMLSLPVIAPGKPEILHGEHLLDREVRWVHTSEIYEIGSLLKGGEVLLTTGLGLVGQSAPEQLRAYVSALTERSVTALVMELGRSFPEVPAELVAEAIAQDLPLIVLHDVVPFIEVTEVVHGYLVEQDASNLRRSEQVNAQLVDSLLSGGGLPHLLRRVALLAGCPAVLLAGDGRRVAASDERAVVDGPSMRGAVEVFGVEWGQLVLCGISSLERSTVLDRGVVAVALELVRGASVAPARSHARRELLLDIALDRFGFAAELPSRAAAVGFVAVNGERLVAICFGIEGAPLSRTVVNAAEEAGRRVFGAPLVAELEGDILLAGAIASSDVSRLREILVQVADIVDLELSATTGGRVAAMTAGHPVDDIGDLGRSVMAAREASMLARRLGGARRALLASDLGAYRFLARYVHDPELGRFIDEQLRDLIDHDARRGRELLRTLESYLENGLSKTRTAEALGVRRQTLYSRLERIESLLGHLDLAEREQRVSLDLALIAWRLRESTTQPGSWAE